MTIHTSLIPLLIAALLAASDAFAQSAAGIRWTPPAAWRVEGPRPMRAATYAIPLASGDHGAAECVVNYFGSGQGGGVDANVERWKSQMIGSDGKPAAAAVTSRVVHGVKITVVDASGSYTGMGGPMARSSKPVAGYRLLGAIAEGRGGPVFFKLTGPSRTLAEQKAAFDRMLDSIQPE